MKKQFRMLILCLIAVAFSAFALFVAGNDGGVLGFSVIGSEQAQQMLRDNAPINMLFCNMLLQGESVPYDKETNTYYVFQPGAKWEGRLTFGSYAYTGFWVSDEPEALSPTGRYSLIISDGKGAGMCNVEICNNPLLFITLDSCYMEESPIELLRFIDERCSYKLFSFDKAYGRILAQSGTAHLLERGALSRTQDKKSFKFILTDDKLYPDKKVLLGLRNDEDWILNPLSTDIDNTHEKVAYKLWAQMDEADPSFSARSSDCEYVEVCLNNNYRGLYLLQTRVDAKQTALDRDKDVLYKSNSHNLPSDVDIERDGHTGSVGTVKIAYAPTVATVETWQALKRYRDLSFMNINEPPTMSWSEAEAIVNVPNIIDFYLFRQAIHAEDNSIKNVFFLADGAREGRITKIPWDLNYSFGDTYSTSNDMWTEYRVEWGEKWTWEGIIRALLAIDKAEMAKLFKQRWELHSEAALSPANVRELMLSSFHEIWDSGAFRRNATRWSAIEPNYTYEEWMERFDVILGAYEQKWRQIDDYVRELAAENAV